MAPFNYFSFPPAAELSSQTIRLVSLERGAVPSHRILNCTSLQISLHPQSVQAQMLSVTSLSLLSESSQFRIPVAELPCVPPTIQHSLYLTLQKHNFEEMELLRPSCCLQTSLGIYTPVTDKQILIFFRNTKLSSFTHSLQVWRQMWNLIPGTKKH